MEKRLVMINYVGQERKGLKDESFKEHTLIHLFWAAPQRDLLWKTFFLVSILSMNEFRKNTVCLQRGPQHFVFSRVREFEKADAEI